MHWETGIGLFLPSTLLIGCASTTARENEALLARPYQGMQDQELLGYYLELTDQIARAERQGTGTGIGVGVGTGIGSRSGLGVGVSRGISGGAIAEDLRERRNEVRLERLRRGVQP